MDEVNDQVDPPKKPTRRQQDFFDAFDQPEQIDFSHLPTRQENGHTIIECPKRYARGYEYDGHVKPTRRGKKLTA